MSVSLSSVIEPLLPLLGREVIADSVESFEVPSLYAVENGGHGDESHGDGSS